MKTFVELTTREIALLTDEEVRRYVKIAQMEDGCPEPREPVAPIPPKFDDRGRITVYSVKRGYSTVATFKDAADAEKCRALVACSFDQQYDSAVGYENVYITPAERVAVESAVVFSAEEFKRVRDSFAEYKAAKEQYEKDAKEYQKALERSTAAGAEVRAARSKSLAVKLKVEEIEQTWKDYLALTDGDPNVAAKFIERAFAAESVAQWREWSASGYFNPAPAPGLDGDSMTRRTVPVLNTQRVDNSAGGIDASDAGAIEAAAIGDPSAD